MKQILTIAKEEHLRSWKDKRFISIMVVTIAIIVMFLVIYSQIPKSIILIAVNYFLKKNVLAQGSLIEAELNLFFNSVNILMSILLIFTSILLSYNAISHERELKSLRFVFSKVSRRSYFIGKYLSLLLFKGIVLAIVYGSILVYVYVKLGAISFDKVIFSFLLMLFYGSAWISVNMLVSTMTQKSMFSLFFSLVMPFLFLIITFVEPIKALSLFSYVSFTTINSSMLFSVFYLALFSFVALIFSCIILEVIDV